MWFARERHLASNAFRSMLTSDTIGRIRSPRWEPRRILPGFRTKFGRGRERKAKWTFPAARDARADICGRSDRGRYRPNSAIARPIRHPGSGQSDTCSRRRTAALSCRHALSKLRSRDFRNQPLLQRVRGADPRQLRRLRRVQSTGGEILLRVRRRPHRPTGPTPTATLSSADKHRRASPAQCHVLRPGRLYRTVIQA